MSIATVTRRIDGSPRGRFLQEFFGNSAQFPIANILLELLLEGPRAYFAAPDAYAIAVGALVQAAILSRPRAPVARRFWGNFAGPAIYTAIEVALEGLRFFDSVNHLAYWGYGAAIAVLQSANASKPAAQGVLQVAEDVVKASILLTMYAIFETASAAPHAGGFFADASHRFVALATLLLGLSIGLAHVTAARYLRLLRETVTQLEVYSEWLLGRELLEKSMHDPHSLTLRPQRRAVLFMDIRGFTRWSESRSPDTIVAMLNGYYQTAERIVADAVKYKFSADELMAVFPNAQAALNAARSLRADVRAFLARESLGAGIAVHAGALVEGLLGTQGVKFYDAIGDTVNTAKRIEGCAQAGELLVSADALSDMTTKPELDAPRRVAVKGKASEIEVYPVLETRAPTIATTAECSTAASSLRDGSSMNHEKITVRATATGQTMNVTVFSKRAEAIEVVVGEGVHSVRCTLTPTRNGMAYAGSVMGREIVYEHSREQVKADLERANIGRGDYSRRR